MTDVVLFNPKSTETLKIGEVYYACPPLDLCYIASVLEQNDFTVKIYDSNVESEERFIDCVLREKPGIVGITAPSVALPQVYHALEEINGKGRGFEVIMVGQHVSEDPGILVDLGLRYGFVGYCEQGFTDLCRYLLRGDGDLSKVDGLIQNVNSKLILNKKQPYDLDSIPLPARHLLNVKRYKYVSISASRGCQYKCLYCSSSGPFYPHSREYLLRKPGNVVEEMKDVIEKHNLRLFDFVDDVFTYDKNYVKEFCRLIRNENINVQWTCSTRPDLISEDIALEMKNSGCVQICIGVESGSEAVRKKISRDISDSEIRKAFRVCRNIGLRTRASALVGLLGETRTDVENTIDFLAELKPTYVFLYPVILLPGSRLYNLALEEALIQKDSWVKYMRGELPLPIYIPQGMKREDISEYLKKGHRRFYLSLGYLLQRMSKARSISDIQEYVGFIHNYLS